MSAARTNLVALIVLVLHGAGAIGAQSTVSPSAASDDRARCASGEIEACVRINTAGCVTLNSFKS